jgi:hypothetical protein
MKKLTIIKMLIAIVLSSATVQPNTSICNFSGGEGDCSIFTVTAQQSSGRIAVTISVQDTSLSVFVAAGTIEVTGQSNKFSSITPFTNLGFPGSHTFYISVPNGGPYTIKTNIDGSINDNTFTCNFTCKTTQQPLYPFLLCCI